MVNGVLIVVLMIKVLMTIIGLIMLLLLYLGPL